MAVGPGWRDYRPSSRLHSTARVIEACRRSLMLGYSTLVVGDDHRGTCVIPWRAPCCSAAGATAFPRSERRGLRIRTILRQPSLLRVVGMTVTAAINGHDLNYVTSSEQRMRTLLRTVRLALGCEEFYVVDRTTRRSHRHHRPWPNRRGRKSRGTGQQGRALLGAIPLPGRSAFPKKH